MVPTNYSYEPVVEHKDLYLNGIDIFHECAFAVLFLLALNFICYGYKLTVAKLIAHQMSLQRVRYFLCGLLSACCIEEFVE